MAFVVPTRRGTFEVRESHATPEGPRSRTLVTFTELTEEVIQKARSRAAKPPSAQELRAAAARAGAPVPGTAVDEATRNALRLLAHGEKPDPMLRRLLLDALSEAEGGPQGEPRRERRAPAVSDAARSATEWIGVGIADRARALGDLLELADALPVRFRSTAIGFPRLSST
jgi:hypothetical protein